MVMIHGRRVRQHLAVALSFLGCMLVGCSDDAPGTLQFLDPVEAGESVGVEYRRSAQDPFNPGDTLYLSVVYTRPEGRVIARYLPDRTDEESLHFTFVIPEGAEFVRCILCAREQPLQSRELAAIVTKDDVPVRGSLRHAMLYAQNHTEARRLFDEIARLHPDDDQRYAALWYGEFRSGMASLSHVEEVVSTTSAPLGSGDSKERDGDRSALQALAAFYGGDVDVTIQRLASLQAMRDMQSPLVCEVLRQIWIVCFGMHAAEMDDDTRYRVGRVILDLASAGVKDLDLFTEIARAFPRFSGGHDSLRIERVVACATRAMDASDGAVALGQMELVRHLMDYWDARHSTREVRELYERHAASLERSLLWHAGNDNPWVSFMPQYGIESECRSLYGKALARSGEPERARVVLEDLIRRDTRPDNLYAICEALRLLGRMAADAKDTVEFNRLRERFVDCQCRSDAQDVFKVGRRPGGDGGVPARATSRYLVPLAWVETDIGRVALNVDDGIPRLLLMTSKTCSICDIQLPAIARLARRWNPRTQLLLVQYEGDAAGSTLKRLVPQGIPVLNHKQVLQAFNIRGVPDVRLIVNGEVVVSGVTDSVSFKRVLSTLN